MTNLDGTGTFKDELHSTTILAIAAEAGLNFEEM
jgi:hypothetical protein